MNSVNTANNLTTKNNSGVSTFFFYFILLIFSIFVIMIIVFYINYSMVVCGPDGKIGFFEYLSYLDINAPFCKEPESVRDYIEREVKKEDEIFHISDQRYTYPEAYEKCKAYGAELATYNQLLNYYNKGGEFLSYGWSSGGNAYYPVQPDTHFKMVKEGKKNPPPYGVNGGRFEKKFKFGVNCYGVKPEGEVVCQKPVESDNNLNNPICKNNPEACNILTTDNISSFNNKKWSIWDSNPTC